MCIRAGRVPLTLTRPAYFYVSVDCADLLIAVAGLLFLSVTIMVTKISVIDRPATSRGFPFRSGFIYPGYE
jgi:uncharacterized protein YbjT (DUF2867 family)